MKKLTDERFLKKILLIFLCIQPILDCYILYTDEVINFFHFSPTTILRMLIIAFLFCSLFFNKENKKNRKIIYIYGGLIIIYTILHHLITSGVDNSGYPTFSYSIITELFYIIRMLLPIVIIYLTYLLKPTKDEFIKLFLIVGLITSGIIVCSNILEISLASYGGGTIKGNIFDWFFSNKYGSQDLASKGWFNSANQISGLMFILLPICVYSLFDKITKPRVITIILLVISMIMLGTRVASYGWLLIFIMMIILYLFFALIMKNIKFEWKKFLIIFLIMIFGIFLMLNAPIVSSNIDHHESTEEELQKMRDENVPTIKMLGYIGMNEEYYKEIYPYKDHKDFWQYVLDDVAPTRRVGNRNSQQLVTNDVAKTYEDFPRSLFGLGYSRFINAKLYLEKDFVVHFYTIGIIGIVLLIFPYVFIAIYGLFKSIKNKKFNLFIVTVLAILVLPLGVSYFSGHIVDELIISLYLGFIGGYILCECKEASEDGQS
ncbi:putative uncharacterized protein [Firmicutes bacterium CAG:822]|nr:putative uncharacterized protein [Firmicutes bacterium CAG:822]